MSTRDNNPVNNNPEKSFASDSRQQKRQRKLGIAYGNLARRFRTVTERSVQWPVGMPRKVRRAIVRDAAKMS